MTRRADKSTALKPAPAVRVTPAQPGGSTGSRVCQPIARASLSRPEAPNAGGRTTPARQGNRRTRLDRHRRVGCARRAAGTAAGFRGEQKPRGVVLTR